MKTAHTPGPWKYWHRKSGRPLKYDLARLIAANGRRIWGCYGGEGFKALGNTREDIANARLIAAAPELLKSLRDLMRNVNKDLHGYWTESTANLMQQAEQAVAKARGK